MPYIVYENENVSHSFMSDSLQLCGLQPTRLLCRWNSLGKNTGLDIHSLLQGIFPTQGPNPGFLHHMRILYHMTLQGSSVTYPITEVEDRIQIKNKSTKILLQIVICSIKGISAKDKVMAYDWEKRVLCFIQGSFYDEVMTSSEFELRHGE